LSTDGKTAGKSRNTVLRGLFGVLIIVGTLLAAAGFLLKVAMGFGGPLPDVLIFGAFMVYFAAFGAAAIKFLRGAGLEWKKSVVVPLAIMYAGFLLIIVSIAYGQLLPLVLGGAATLIGLVLFLRRYNQALRLSKEKAQLQ
jgi:hypothetical protein